MTATTERARPAAIANDDGEERDGSYYEVLRLIERLNAQLIDVIKIELERRAIRDVNGVQALLLFNMGDEELSAGALKTRGCYLGTNVSYNLNKLTELGYVNQTRLETDKRVSIVRLTEKGERVRAVLEEMFARHLRSFDAGYMPKGDFEAAKTGLERLQRLWFDQTRFRL